MSTAGQRHLPFDRRTGRPAPEVGYPALPRTDLLRQLDAAADTGRTILLSAPAGTGKTTLLTTWLAHRRTQNPATRTIWITADSRRDRSLWPELSGRVRIGGGRVAELAEVGPVVVVIDMAHEIGDAQMLGELEELVDLASSNVTVVVAGRCDPPVRWHALELRGALARFGIRELVLTAAEVEELCAQHGCVLEGVVLERVMALTDGWAALVRMAALQLAARPRDRATSLSVLARPPQLISEFLAREVVTPLPAHVREFLTRTAIPDSFTEALADRLTGRSARAALDELDRGNIPLRRENRDGALWFSYPPLLRAHLLAEARGLDAATLAELRRVTAHSYLAAGQPLSALEQLRELTDPAPLRDVLRDLGLGLVLDGAGPRLFCLLEQCDPALETDPYLHILRAVDALTQSEISRATAHLELATAPASSVCVPEQWLVVMRRAVAVEITVATGRSPAGFAPATGSEPTGNQDVDAYAAVQDAMVLLVGGEVAAGEGQLRRALALAQHARHSRLALRSTNRLAVASGVEGSIAGMRERAQRALDIAGTHRLMDSADALQAVVMTALAAHVQGDDQGRRHFADVLADAGRRGVFGPGSHEHVVAQVLAFDAAPDRYRAAQSLRHSMSTLLHRSLPPFTLGLLVQSVWALLRVPDGRAAQQLVAEARRAVGEHPAVTLCEAGLARAANRPRSVLALTTPMLAVDGVNPLMAVLARLLDATAHAELGNSLKAYESTADALRCAEPEHLVRPFLDVPGVLDLLDTFGVRFGHEDAYAARVRHHPAATRGPATHPALTS
ncbi:hypothetical protein, partial [Nocardia sp. NPDC004722]